MFALLPHFLDMKPLEHPKSQRLFSRQKHTISITFQVSESESDFAHFGSEGRGWAYCSGYGMNEDFSLKLPIEGFQNLYFPASDMGISNMLEEG